jgi:hypothetical protein
MKQTRINANEFLVIFDSHAERAHYLATHRFKYKPSVTDKARWVCDNNGGDKEHLVILTPMDPHAGPDPILLLQMRARLVRKEPKGVATFG